MPQQQAPNNDMPTPKLDRKVRLNLPKIHISKTEKHFSLKQLLVFALAFALIGSYFLYRSFAAAPVVATVEAESMSLPPGAQTFFDTSASGGKAVKMARDGTILSTSVTLSAAVDSIEVVARGNVCSSAWPTMTVSVDGIDVKSWPVNASTWTKYQVSKSLTSGGHTLAIKLTNQNKCPYLYIDVTTFYGLALSPVLLSQNKPASASTVYSAGAASSAFDGDSATRWSSVYSDPQWLSVDLGSNATITGVKLNWENAYGKAYQIQVSNDNATWSDIYSTTTGDGGLDDITGLAASGRYVRMYGTQRGTQWGYSLYEMSVYGAIQSSPAPTVSFSVSPMTIDYNGSATLVWSSANATACIASGGWSNAIATSGSQSTGALIQTKTYNLTCTGTGGSASASVTVNVRPQAYVIRGIFDDPTYNYGLNTEPGLSFSDTWSVPYKSNLDKVYSKILPNGQHMKAWLWVGTFSKATCSFTRTDTQIRDYLTSGIVNHPANNHRYVIADDTEISPTNGCTNMLNTIKARSDLIRSLDNRAITSVSEYRTGYMSRWKGIVMELWLDGYPNLTTGYDYNIIPNVSQAAEAAGMPYVGVLGAHTNACGTAYLKVPTAALLHQEFEQWRATKMIGYTVFHWQYPVTDCSPSVWLKNHTDLQDQLKIENQI